MSIFEELPPDAEAAFLLIEAELRDDCEKSIQNDTDNAQLYRANYIAQVIAVIHELELSHEFTSKVPPINQVSYHTYLEFGKDVLYYRTRLQIRASRRSKGYSVKLDEVAKKKLRHLIDKIRETLDKLEIEERKRNALYAKLSALELEVDRDRTRIEVYGDLVVAAAGLVGEAGEKLEPVRKLLDSIAGVFHEARGMMNDVLQLPSPPKRIEHKPNTDHDMRDLDEEVPF